ncbi:hypothetical protein [Clostridium massiliamazoniense]|uniref:hypothetical protein n=1 Tax=Clostridium massiliamazoniense TaxID=1347366 RepID=UPI0018D0925C|nr:hypothetical protein [Clostridium massiliamazoniense]
MTMKEVAKIKEENEILKKLCKILGVLHSFYYAKLNHTVSTCDGNISKRNTGNI